MSKVEVDRTFLDSKQYARQSILDYEAVYGQDFVSPGGKSMARELIARMGLQPGSRILDAGCGLGGSAFLMAQEFRLTVDGIDLSKNMIGMARGKLESHGLGHIITLIHGDCLELENEDEYQGIYSRDVFLHIHDKQRLFKVLFRALEASGKLLFTDYCCSEKPWSDDFSSYVEGRGYSLHTLDSYTAYLREAGFEEVVSVDMTERFIDILQDELNTIAGLKLADTVKRKMEDSWREKLRRARSGYHRWGLFTAIKP